MNRATRDSFASGTQKDLTTGNAVWETPPLVFQKLNEDFGPFHLDLTADAQRALCRHWLGPQSPLDQVDALQGGWHNYGSNGYSNPPYGPFVQRILPLAKLAALHDGFTSTFLLPMRVTAAFRLHILRGASELLFCSQRITFFENGEPRWNVKALAEGRYVPDPAMFDSIIVRYIPRPKLAIVDLKVGEWQVPEHVQAAIARKQAA